MQSSTLQSCLFIPLICVLFSATVRANVTVIEREQDRWQLRRDGKPYVANGACIWGEAAQLDVLVAAGGNAVRTYDPAHAGWTLRQAGRRGLTVMLSFDPGKPRHGFDYTDEKRVLEQRARFEAFVRQHKDDPALLAWSVGNEVEFTVTDAEVFARVMTEMNLLAGLARAIDPNHPVGVSVAGMDERLGKFIMARCPNFQYVGINAYGGARNLPKMLDKLGFDRPYLLTEFGPNGSWEVPTTGWGAPVEPTSTEKEQQYLDAHKAVTGDARCLGSYAFYWGNKQETTATWFGLFLKDGRRTGPIDAMTFAWTGRWPEQRAPQIESLTFAGRASPEFAPGEAAKAALALKGNTPVTYEWSITRESDDRKLGGDFERDQPVTSEGLRPTDDGHVAITMPTKPGAYRLCAFITNRDGRGSVATANLCFRVKE